MSDNPRSEPRSHIAGRLGEKHLDTLLGVVEDDSSPLGNEIKTFDRYRNSLTLKMKQLARKASVLYWLVRYDRGRIRYRTKAGCKRSRFTYGTREAFKRNPVEVFVLYGEHIFDAIVMLGTMLERRDTNDGSTFKQLYYVLPFARAFERWEPWREGVWRHPDIDPADLESSLRPVEPEGDLFTPNPADPADPLPRDGIYEDALDSPEDMPF
jgi:hypothetical protein